MHERRDVDYNHPMELCLRRCARGLLLCAAGSFGIPACTKSQPALPAPSVACAPSVPSVPSCEGAIQQALTAEQDARTAEAESQRLRTLTERIFSGEDSAQVKRVRRPAAVLLFAPPVPHSDTDESGTAWTQVLRFQPLVCASRGRLLVGAACGQLMPARATVRLTQTSGSAEETLEVERATLPFEQDPGGAKYPVPFGPACCMYNTCVGRTIPYYPRRVNPDAVLTTNQTVLAVWPADAEIDLTIFKPGQQDEAESEAPKAEPAEDSRRQKIRQSFVFKDRRYVSLSQGSLHALLFEGPASDSAAAVHSGQKSLLRSIGVSRYYVLAATDVNTDGKPEFLVYAHYANDYGLDIITPGVAEPLYSFSCGNI